LKNTLGLYILTPAGRATEKVSVIDIGRTPHIFLLSISKRRILFTRLSSEMKSVQKHVWTEVVTSINVSFLLGR
jgi:ABC-type nickel/cobalt efflux system permease component RcnA